MIHRGLPFQVCESPDFVEDYYSERRQVMNELAACSQYAQAHQERLLGKQVFGQDFDII